MTLIHWLSRRCGVHDHYQEIIDASTFFFLRCTHKQPKLLEFFPCKINHNDVSQYDILFEEHLFKTNNQSGTIWLSGFRGKYSRTWVMNPKSYYVIDPFADDQVQASNNVWIDLMATDLIVILPVWIRFSVNFLHIGLDYELAHSKDHVLRRSKSSYKLLPF